MWIVMLIAEKEGGLVRSRSEPVPRPTTLYYHPEPANGDVLIPFFWELFLNEPLLVEWNKSCYLSFAENCIFFMTSQKLCCWTSHFCHKMVFAGSSTSVVALSLHKILKMVSLPKSIKYHLLTLAILDIPFKLTFSRLKQKERRWRGRRKRRACSAIIITRTIISNTTTNNTNNINNTNYHNISWFHIVFFRPNLSKAAAGKQTLRKNIKRIANAVSCDSLS